MKPSVLEWVICPECHNRLKCDVFREERLATGSEVMEGLLICSCEHAYPIIGGIPRLLPDE